LDDDVQKTFARIFLAKDKQIVLEALKFSLSHFSLSMLEMVPFNTLSNRNCINTSSACIFYKLKLILPSNFSVPSFIALEKFEIAGS
jgi:hypothetical protein